MTQSELARELGVSRQLVAAHHKKPGSPPLDDLQGWITYLATKGRIGSAPEDLRSAIAQKRLEILQETKTKLERENRIADGEVILTSAAIRHASEAGSYFIQSLETVCRELPPMLAGQSTDKIAIILETHTERIRKRLIEKLNEIGKVAIKPMPKITLSGGNVATSI